MYFFIAASRSILLLYATSLIFCAITASLLFRLLPAETPGDFAADLGETGAAISGIDAGIDYGALEFQPLPIDARHL